jgi:hypothetical protein
MSIRGKAPHVNANFRDDDFGDPQSDTGNGLKQLHRIRHERVGALGDLPHDLLADAGGCRLKFGKPQQ